MKVVAVKRVLKLDYTAIFEKINKEEIIKTLLRSFAY